MTTPEAEVAQRPKPWYESFFGPDYLKQYAHTTTLQEVEGVAKILLERFNRESLATSLPSQSWQVRDDRSVILYEDTFDILRGRYETRQIVIDREGTREHRASVRAYTFPELKELFEEAGLFVHR